MFFAYSDWLPKLGIVFAIQPSRIGLYFASEFFPISQKIITNNDLDKHIQAKGSLDNGAKMSPKRRTLLSLVRNNVTILG